MQEYTAKGGKDEATKDPIDALRNTGVSVDSVKKRMAKGTLMAAPPVNALLIDDTMSHVFDAEAILAMPIEDGEDRKAA